MPRKSSSLNRILGRLDNLDSANLTILVQRLARERELLETVFNSIHDGIVVLDHRGLIQYANSPSLALIGLNEDDIGHTTIGEKWPDLNRWVDLDALAESKDSQTLVSREIEMNYPERRIIRLFLLPLSFPMSNAAVPGWLMVLSDITEDKEHTEEVIESERVASIMLLAAGVAHEIGNPLNSLTIHLQLIQRKLETLEGCPSTDRIRKSVQVCSEEVKRLDGILTHFLGAIRHTPPDLRDTDLLLIIEEVVQVQEEMLKSRSITVDIEFDGPVPIILADINQIKQVLFNVLKNAVEAMPREGHLRIRTRSDDEFVYVMVADTGCGMDPDDLANVFKPYFSTKKEGHGLGMMVVERIMRAHGAKIGIDSRKGKGTVVTLQFPQKHRRVRLLEQG